MRLLLWLVYTAALVAAIIAGALHEVVWCSRIAGFVVWVTAVLTFLNCDDFDPAKALSGEVGVRPKVASSSIWFSRIDVGIDVAIILFLAAVGWTVTALAWIATSIMSENMRGRMRAAAKKEGV